MTTSIWTGPGGTGSHPKSGAFEDAGNWANGATPAQDNNVAFAPGKYTVTLSSEVYEVGGLTIGAGATLYSSANDTQQGFLELTQDSTNSGHMLFASTQVVVGANATLTNFGEMSGLSAYYRGGSYGSGAIDNYGLIHPSSGGLYFVQNAATHNELGGIIDSQGGGAVAILGDLTNDGTVSAVDHGSIVFSYGREAGGTTNLQAGTLTGGHWSAIGQGATLQFRDGDGLDTIGVGADVTLSGSGSIIQLDDTGDDIIWLENSLSHILDGGALHVLGGRSFASSQDLDIAGLFELGGGTLSSDGLTVHDDATSALAGYGVVMSDMDMFGVLRAAKNHDNVSLQLTGNSTVYNGASLVGGGTLEIAAGVDHVQDNVQVLVKSLVVSGGELDLGENLTYAGKLRVTGDGVLRLGGDVLRVTGSLDQVNGTIDQGTLQIETTHVTVQGSHAEWSADVRNNGEVDVTGGHLTLARTLNGVGVMNVSGGATVEFGGGVTTGQTIDLQGSGDKLVFDNASTFRGNVAEFGAGDTLDFANIAFAGATFSWKGDNGADGGTLTVSDGAHSGSIHLTDAHIRNSFHLVDDGAGHAAVTYGAAPGAHAEFLI